jgi:hypothetical protein
MNKILDINEKFSYYTVEPGVSFFQLFQTIQEQKKKIWSSTPALGWGSVVGNALDRVSCLPYEIMGGGGFFFLKKKKKERKKERKNERC